MRKRLLALIFGASIGVFINTAFGHHTPEAKAHGSNIKITQSTEIQATFETGEPMADAQVLIYAPTDLQTPWTTAKTDGEGRFNFMPDAQQPGQWEVTVRLAGHGHTTAFLVGEAANSSSALQGPAAGPVQKWVAIAATIWGFVGTALFFSNRPSGGKA
ncbi:MAG: carboxypeptidase regulatory-like domain-containing protein [Cyanobacteria bacterium J06631_12]